MSAHSVHHRDSIPAQMRNQRRVVFERRVAVRIAVGVKREPHFIRRRFFARFRRSRARRRRRFAPANFLAACFASPNFCQSSELDGVGPAGFVFGALSIAPSIAATKRHPHFRRDEECLHKKHRRQKREDAEHDRISRNRGQRFPPGSEKRMR